MPPQIIKNDEWYNHPRYYDLAFRRETKREADFIEAACRKYLPFPPKRLLEPACGTGRLVVELAARGYQLSGFDLNRPSLDFLRRRLARRKLSARLFEADMADFHVPRQADAAFCTVNSFRLLLTEQAARRHLECVAESLRPGGIYILALHLIPPDAADDDCERWTERQGQTKVSVTLRVISTDWRRRIERLRMSMLVRTARREFRIRDEFCFRLYRLGQFRRLLASTPSLELEDVYDFWYDIEQPLPLNKDSADTVFILRKRE